MMDGALADKKLLTDAIVRGLGAPASGNKITYDGGDPKKRVRGFGVRVTAAGARAFILNYRVGGIERRYTIGSFPDWSVSAAREEAKRLRREIDRGEDPVRGRRDYREAPTIADLCERYIEEHASARKRERSRLEDESLIRQWIRPELGAQKVAEIKAVDVEKLHRKITRHGTPIRANRVVTLLSRMLSLAVRWELRGDNPASGIERNQEEPRQRYLSGDELRRLTEALAAHPNQDAANAIRLLLLTGARRTEVLAATWDHFDLGKGVWTKPSSHTKQNREHRVPLSAPVRQLLGEMKASADRLAAGANREPSPFLFPAQRRARGAQEARGHLVEIKGAWAAICKLAGLSGVRVHDLRHSYASILASAGLSLPVIGALLGHTQPGTTARYAHLFDDPLRAAAERVGAIVTASSSGKSVADVIQIKHGSGSRDPGGA
jgi:integrase